MQDDFIRYCRANRLSEVSIKDYINSLDMVSRELLDKRFDESEPKEFINLTNDDYLKLHNQCSKIRRLLVASLNTAKSK